MPGADALGARIGDHPKVRQPRHHPGHWPMLLGIVQVLIGGIVARHHDMTFWGYPLLLAGPAVLLLTRERRPDLGVAAVAAVTLGFLSLGYPVGPVVPSTIAAVVGAVVRGARIAAWLSLGGLWLGWLALGLFGVRDLGSLLQEARGLGLALLLAGFAELVDNRRQRGIAYRKLWEEERRRRDEEAARRAGEERLRIARELHDVLAHSLSLITVRASVALELMDSNPQEVRDALQAIKQASKSGLDEVRSVLHGLRTTSDGAPRTPAPDLSRLDDLVAQSGAAGLTVSLARTGPWRDVPAAVGLAGYRIVQEALTNVLRHSQARTAVVHVHHTGWALLIGVTDNGPSRSRVDGSGPPTPHPAPLGKRPEPGSQLSGRPETGHLPDQRSGRYVGDDAAVDRSEPGLVLDGRSGQLIGDAATHGRPKPGGLFGVHERAAALGGRPAPAGGRSPVDGGGVGSGLIGIQERAAALGGYAEVGPEPGGGFAVRVALPAQVREET